MTLFKTKSLQGRTDTLIAGERPAEMSAYISTYKSTKSTNLKEVIMKTLFKKFAVLCNRCTVAVRKRLGLGTLALSLLLPMMILCSNTAQALNIEVQYAEDGDPFGATSSSEHFFGVETFAGIDVDYIHTFGDEIQGTDDTGGARVEFQKAVSLLEAMIKDDITVRVRVGWSVCDGQAQVNSARLVPPYNAFDPSDAFLLPGLPGDPEADISQGWRALTVNDEAAEDNRLPVVSKLPETVSDATLDSGTIPWIPLTGFWGSGSNQIILMTTANMKALLKKESIAKFEQFGGILEFTQLLQSPESPIYLNQVDMAIRFCINERVDFDTTIEDGIDDGKRNFFGVAMHELIHGLGFTSFRNGDTTIAFPTPVDMFTFSEEVVKTVNLGQVFGDPNTPRIFTSAIGDPRHMLYLGEQMIVPMETGLDFGPSHWLNLVGAPNLGVMDPSGDGITGTEAIEPDQVKRTDLTVLDAIGYDINTDFVNISQPLMSEKVLRELLGKPHGPADSVDKCVISPVTIDPSALGWITGEGL